MRRINAILNALRLEEGEHFETGKPQSYNIGEGLPRLLELYDRNEEELGALVERVSNIEDIQRRQWERAKARVDEAMAQARATALEILDTAVDELGRPRYPGKTRTLEFKKEAEKGGFNSRLRPHEAAEVLNGDRDFSKVDGYLMRFPFF